MKRSDDGIRRKGTKTCNDCEHARTSFWKDEIDKQRPDKVYCFKWKALVFVTQYRMCPYFENRNYLMSRVGKGRVYDDDCYSTC